jgi:hypothetical protein
MIDREKQCGACQNLDAYWEERARHDPQLRQRLLQLQRQNEFGPGRERGEETEADLDCADECLDPDS